MKRNGEHDQKKEARNRRIILKGIGSYISILAVLVLLSGCGETAKIIATKTQGQKSDIFAEVVDGTAVPAGYGDVMISASIKTHLEDFYIGESKASAHGKAAYPFVFNIDGQAVVWKTEGKEDELPKYDADGKTSQDPEAGTGMKYVLNKKIRLRAGSHRFFFGLPEENYYREFVVFVKDGETHTLNFKPHYSSKTIPTRIPTFLKGMSYYDILFDGQMVKS